MNNKQKGDLPGKKIFHWNSLWLWITIVITFISLSAVVILLNIISNRFNKMIDYSTQSNNIQIVENVTLNIENYINEMISVSESVPDILNSTINEGISEHNYFFLREDIDTVAVFDSNGVLVMNTQNTQIKTNADIKNQSWFNTLVPGSKLINISSPHVQQLYEGNYMWVISLSKNISWEDNEGNTKTGVLLVDLNFKKINDLCSKKLGEDGYIYIVNNNGKIIFHPRQQTIYAGIVEDDVILTSNVPEGNTIVETKDKRISVSSKEISSVSWKVVGISSLKGILSFDNGLVNYIKTISVFAFFSVLFSSIAISILITRPIRKLIILMKKVEKGDLKTYSNEKGLYEIKELSKSFNEMVYQIDFLIKKNSEEQKRLRKSEMKTLQAQITPHFLYNTLGSISWLAENGDSENVIKMIDALAKFFRISLSGGKDSITVDSELKHAENYLIIQKMRYNDQFDYSIDCDEETLNLQTVKIVLQPIIENAISHGVGNSIDKGHINIKAFHTQENLIFKVSDNGCGIKPQQLKNILNTATSSKSGIGIKNVNSRIQLMCGAQYGLRYESEPDEGTTVTITLPIISDKEDFNG